MKKYFIIAIAALSLSSCKQAELDKAKRQNDSLQSVISQRDTSVFQFISAFNDVERNLDSVTQRQQIIYQTSEKTGAEVKSTKKAHINAQIAAINTLMDKNRKEIIDLNRKLKTSGNKNVQLVKSIATLTNQLVQKDKELASLNMKLGYLNIQIEKLLVSVDTLSDQNHMESLTIDEATAALHTAYFVVGTTKQLKDAEIIDRKGGLLGIGRTSKLSENIDKSKFNRIDFTETKSITINSNDVKIITSHPADSYRLDKDDKNVVTNLVITNAEHFWATSKYLVIVKK